MCFAGSILGNFLVGESVIMPLKNNQDVILAAAVWYVCAGHSVIEFQVLVFSSTLQHLSKFGEPLSQIWVSMQFFAVGCRWLLVLLF